MERRAFLKNTTIAAAGVSLAGLYGFGRVEQHQGSNPFLVTQRASSIPVIKEVDVLVVGGGASAVAAAVAAAQSGASVFLVAAEPYLGADICGTLRLWDIETGFPSDFAHSLTRNGKVPEPAFVKCVLQKYLIGNQIEFLLSSYAGGIVYDEANEMAGVVIVNRSGEQIVKSTSVIDATETALVSRLAGVTLEKSSSRTSEYRFTVVGNNVKEKIAHRQLTPLEFKGKSYPVTEYRFNAPFDIDSFDMLQTMEQSIRDQTWDENQVDASDLLFEIPTLNIKTENRTPPRFESAEKLPLSALMPLDNNRLFILNGYANVNFKDKEKLLQPGNMICLGQRLGELVAQRARELPATNLQKVAERESQMRMGATGIIHNREWRPKHQQAVFEVNGEKLPVLDTFENVVVGGGTAGACAAISSARHGSRTLVTEYLHGLGGMGTLGLIGRYWVGYREGFTKEVDEGVRKMAQADHPRQRDRKADWVKDWKMEWYRSEILKAGGNVWFGALACGAIVDDHQVKGIVVATPYGKVAILANNVIDSTGSADIAIAASVSFEFVSADSVAMQGSGLPPVNPDDHYNNTDYTFTDDTDVMDITRSFVAGTSKFIDAYDIGKLPQTRERRRIVGDYKVSVMDMANGRHYHDTISYHYSSFDTHGYTVDPYFIIKPPADATVDLYVNMPLRALLPQGLSHIIVTGLGASADRDAMPIIRMQPCLQNQGYAVGLLAATANKENLDFRQVDFKRVQLLLVQKGVLPREVLDAKDLFPPTRQQVTAAVMALKNDFEQLETVLWDIKQGLEEVLNIFKATPDNQLKLNCAVVLGFHGYPDAGEVLVNEIRKYTSWDKGWNYRGMHQFGMSASFLDALVMALGKSGYTQGWPVIKRLALKLTSESELSHFRAVAEATADLKHTGSAGLLYTILTMPGIGGYAVTNLSQTLFAVKKDTNDNSTRNNALRELFLARALLVCGDYNQLGDNTITTYANDLHGIYSCHALAITRRYIHGPVAG